MKVSELIQLITDKDCIKLLTENPTNQNQAIDFKYLSAPACMKYLNSNVLEVYIDEDGKSICIQTDFRDWND